MSSIPRKPLTKVYRAFFKAGRDNEAGLVKERFLTDLAKAGVNLDKATSPRMARVLKGEITMERLAELYPARLMPAPAQGGKEDGGD
jgi:hypothetical protein